MVRSVVKIALGCAKGCAWGVVDLGLACFGQARVSNAEQNAARRVRDELDATSTELGVLRDERPRDAARRIADIAWRARASVRQGA